MLVVSFQDSSKNMAQISSRSSLSRSKVMLVDIDKNDQDDRLAIILLAFQAGGFPWQGTRCPIVLFCFYETLVVEQERDIYIYIER